MYTPTLAEIRNLKEQGNLVPVYREVGADLETPVSAYLKVAGGGPSFLLESVEGGERIARYSFIGTGPYLTIKSRAGDGDPLAAIEREVGRHKVVPVPGLPRFHGGAVGYLSYETVGHFEELPSPPANPLGLPEATFLLTDTLLVFDHLKHKILVVSHVRLNGNTDLAYAEAVERIDRLVEKLRRPLKRKPRAGNLVSNEPMTQNLSKAEYEARVAKAKECIFKGDIIQVVLSLRLARPTRAAPFDIYRALRSVNPSPYMYYLDLPDCHIVGASPELLVRVEEGTVATHPIAGTRRRGKDSAEDKALEAELRHDEKECAEHIMLVDLGRNDIGRVSEPGTVVVPELMEVERYSHVMHLVSHVEGKLRSDFNQFDAMRACFPAGTVSGAPKIRAMEIIAELEPDKRGPYAGAVGYFGFSGNMDTAITIRTIVLKDGVAYVQAGAGIVQDSVPELEYRESMNKAQALMKAIDQAEEGEG
ncbi:MAG: anthranilate synthase component I [Chloroflexi bacterium]|nr:anthranilate synthase component I [Chloroflexota bacterium]